MFIQHFNLFLLSLKRSVILPITQREFGWSVRMQGRGRIGKALLWIKLTGTPKGWLDEVKSEAKLVIPIRYCCSQAAESKQEKSIRSRRKVAQCLLLWFRAELLSVTCFVTPPLPIQLCLHDKKLTAATSFVHRWPALREGRQKRSSYSVIGLFFQYYTLPPSASRFMALSISTLMIMYVDDQIGSYRDRYVCEQLQPYLY